MSTSDKPRPLDPHALVARERDAFAVHHASLRGGALPSPKSAPRGTFVHGLLLPLSLLMATLRDPSLRGPFLRLAAVRLAVLVVLGAIALATGDSDRRHEKPGVGVVVQDDADEDDSDDDDDRPRRALDEPVDVNMAGVHVHVDKDGGSPEVEILGQKVPIPERPTTTAKAPRTPAPPPPPPSLLGRARAAAARGWTRVAAFVGVLSIMEGVIVFFSRRYDDWLAFYVSGLAGIRPELPEPPVRRLALDLRWLAKKLKRRARGYIIFASGMPLLYLLKLVPAVGSWLFAGAVTLWAWYWGGVFTASKSAHAWADDGIAGPPHLVGAFNRGVANGWWFWPLRVYGRAWAWVVRGINAAATTFDRSPAPFLGLALSRAVLALPGLYLLMRPIVPVAAGRLCAEADPADRFSVGQGAATPNV